MIFTQIRACGIAIVLLLLLGNLPAGAQTTVIVQDGQARATIFIAPDASAQEKLAAQELQSHLQRMSDATLSIITNATEGTGVPIYVGKAAPQPDLKKIEDKSKDKAALRVHVSPKMIQLVGNSDDGTLNAVYELLDQLGVRWFLPEEIGLDVPKARTVTVKQQDFVDAPSFRGRHLQAVGNAEWERRMRLGGMDAGAHGLGAKF